MTVRGKKIGNSVCPRGESTSCRVQFQYVLKAEKSRSLFGLERRWSPKNIGPNATQQFSVILRTVWVTQKCGQFCRGLFMELSPCCCFFPHNHTICEWETCQGIIRTEVDRDCTGPISASYNTRNRIVWRKNRVDNMDVGPKTTWASSSCSSSSNRTFLI